MSRLLLIAILACAPVSSWYQQHVERGVHCVQAPAHVPHPRPFCTPYRRVRS